MSLLYRSLPECPRLLDSIHLSDLVQKLHIETVETISSPIHSNFRVVFILNNDETGNITRAIQEDEILKTKLQTKKNNRIVTLPCFWDIWKTKSELSRIILASEDPNEEKRKCARSFGYKLATTFMPLYAKSIYEHFHAKKVLDPCSGWGDRLLGACLSSDVTHYTGFDPNINLQPGYSKIMNLLDYSTLPSTKDHTIQFSNHFECIALPFEIGVLSLESNSFDLVFTSPPFFEYEIYSPINPKYNNWIQEFYTPLFIQSCRCVKTLGYVAIHIDNTLSGDIDSFLLNKVHTLCSLKFVYKIGLQGQTTGQIRPVWVFQKMN